MFELVAILLAVGTGVISGLVGVLWAKRRERLEIKDKMGK